MKQIGIVVDLLDGTTSGSLSLVPLPWGDQPGAPKLAYSDAFVTSMATCGKDPCASDGTASSEASGF